MPEKMTSKERMLTAMRNQQPDRVPVAPDISNMIPARLTGKPFWDIYMHDDPPLWKAYIQAVRYFGFDGWVQYGGSVRFHTRGDQRQFSTKILQQTAERITVLTVCQTPAGDLTQETVYYVADPPTVTRKWIKNLREDLPKLRYFFPEITGCDDSILREQQQSIGQDGAVGPIVGLPGFHDLFGWFDGSLASASYAYYDDYDLLREFVSWQEAQILRQAEMTIDLRPEFIMIGASGLWTLSTPAAVRDLTLPTLQKITRMAKQAGVPTMLHCCGRERTLAKLCAEETDLDCINPLEVEPQGDCDLAEVKASLGHRLSLFGNIPTTSTMLLGTPADVEIAARKCIDDAAAGGGFILSTGDQCGRDTPDANIFKLVEVAKTYGQYQ
jgi:uroporphyrinogen decarboxylase